MFMTKRRRGTAVVLVLLGLAALWAIFEHIHGKGVLRAYKAELTAKGEKLKVEDLIPPSAAEADLAAAHLTQAAWQLSQNGPVMAPIMRFVAPGKAMVGWKQPDIRDGYGTNRWEELATQLQDNRKALAGIREALMGSRLSWNLDYKQGDRTLLPQLAKLKQCAQWLSAAIVNDLHNGDLEEARADLKSLLSLAGALRDEKLIISQLVGIAMAAIAYGPTWEALQADGWTDAQLATLQTQWESLELAAAMEKSIEMERAMGEELFDRLRRSSDERKQFLDLASMGGTSGPPQRAAPRALEDLPKFALALGRRTIDSVSSFGREILWRWFWSYDDERRCLQEAQLTMNELRQATQKHAFGQGPIDGKERWFDRQQTPTEKYFVSASREEGWKRCILKVRRMETQRELLLTAIALKRYGLRYQKTAPNLNALVPEFLARPPADWMDGKPLRYRVNHDGSFALYSVNEDGKDDGGDATPTRDSPTHNFADGRDMVWPLPATEAEVAEVRARAAGKNRR